MEKQELLEVYRKKLNGKKAFAGFDGYTDFLYTVVRKERNGEKELFHSSAEFVESLKKAAGISSEYEIILKSKKTGGNAPIISLGMAAMGADVSCIGLFDQEDLKTGRELEGRLHVYSLGPPAVTIALEFDDCKYMLADCGELQQISWKNILDTIGAGKIRDMAGGADLIAAVNWSAVPEVKEILEGMLLSGDDGRETAEAMTGDRAPGTKWLFLDLSDIKAKEAEEIAAYFRTVERIRDMKGLKSCLSVNENEMKVLLDRFEIKDDGDAGETFQCLRRRLGVDELILHAMERAVCCSENGLLAAKKKICRNPVITTGAGDNFNAGICIGKLLELPPQKQLEMGNRAAEYYVAHGLSGRLEDMIEEEGTNGKNV